VGGVDGKGRTYGDEYEGKEYCLEDRWEHSCYGGSMAAPDWCLELGLGG
jgi:hypothetical protein